MGLLIFSLKMGEKGFLVELCFLLVLFMEMTSITASTSNSSYQNLQVDAQLKLLNKPAAKSIKSPDGDIIDCIKITHQPAFDHPLLRNHTIQRTPSFYPEGVLGRNKAASNKMKRTKTQLWHLNGSCPKGTIPVRRTKEEDLLRSSIKDFGKKKHRSIPQPRSVEPEVISRRDLQHQQAYAYVGGSLYHGAKATINVWNAIIEQPTDSSSSQIWILAGSSGRDLNSIEVGCHVNPDLYGDSKARIFIYWTRDDYQATGCYNLLCSGFVQIDTDIALGGSFSPVSTYQGTQYDMTVLVRKDANTGNWWLTYADQYVIGYWPSSLFSYLADSASTVHWGGQVLYSGGQQMTLTQMGSGHFAREGFSKASFFNKIQIVDESNNLKAPEGIQTFTDKSNCYDIQLDKSESWGNFFYYGGPGRSQTCP